MNAAALAVLALGAIQAPQLDLTYANVGRTELKLDFFPGAGIKKAPLIIWIHGGGWSGGSRKQAVPARRLQNLYPHYAVASVSYRLSGEAVFPAQIEDCRRAVSWLRSKAGELNLDSARFAVWGSSAGGHLASLVGTVNDWPGDEASKGAKARVQAVINYYGPTDLIALAEEQGSERHSQPSSAGYRLLGGPVLQRREEAKRANPITYVSKDDPPFFIVHGSSDRVVSESQSRLLHEALRSKGIASDLTILEGAGHGGPQFLEEALMKRIHQFLNLALSGK